MAGPGPLPKISLVGNDQANAVYLRLPLVDDGTNNGTGTLPISGTITTVAGGGGSTAINDGTTTSQKLAVDAAGKIGLNNFPASQAVTGAFWQTTQPVSGTVTANAGTGTMNENLAQVNGTAIGSPTAAGTSATGNILAIQGVTGGVPISVSGGGGGGGGAPLTGGATTANAASQAVGIAATNGTNQVPLFATAANALKVDNSAVTQPVSGTFWQTTQPVSGTFFQTTQPVSIATMPSTPVTGTFWQATQPVSGTFFQTTQPVSIASMPTTPVTGTFWQATQPVSLATNTPTLQSGSTTTVTQATGSNLHVVVDTAPTTAVTGTFWQATQPVSGTVAVTESGTWTVQPGNTANTTAWLFVSAHDATATTSVPATASNVVIKASAGRLVNAICTTAGTADLLIYDNASTNSGTIIGIVPATANLGDQFVWAAPAANGITAAASTTTPVATVYWA